MSHFKARVQQIRNSAYSAPPDSLAGFEGLLLMDVSGKEDARRGEGKEEKGGVRPFWPM